MAEGKKVVIVDDDVTAVSVIKNFLESNGYSVTQVSEGITAQEAIKGLDPDIVILDIIMPQTDGFTIAKQLRYDEKTKHIPIIITSVSDEMRELFAIEGITDYLVKPLDNEKLLGLVKKKIGG